MVDTPDFAGLIPNCLVLVLDRAMTIVSEELKRIDPRFVRRFEEIQRAESVQLVHPDVASGDHPTPDVRLGKQWTDLLEALWDFGVQADLAAYSRDKFVTMRVESDEPGIGREFELAMRDWFIQSQAFVEQAKQVARKLIRRSSLEKTKKREIEASYVPVLVDAQNRLAQFRNPWLHGAGGRGRDASGITEERLWEATVAIGFTPNTALPFLYASKREYAKKWQPLFGAFADEIDRRVCESLNGILNELGIAEQ